MVALSSFFNTVQCRENKYTFIFVYEFQIHKRFNS